MPRQFSVTVMVICTTLLGSPAHAGLKDLLNQGQELIKQSTQPQSSSSTATDLDTDTLSAGLREALEIGTQRAVETLSAQDGYLGNPSVRIPMPGYIETASGLLRAAGLGNQVDTFELSMNRAAEAAVTEATPIFVEAVKAMTIDDARRIYNGGDNAATEYFKTKTYDRLGEKFKPRIEESMAQYGVTSAYQLLVDSAGSKLPMLGNMNLDLADHVTGKALDGLFLMLAEEEKKIREQPLARSTDLLKQVFGN
ncbi:hypothetical protein GCM10011352_16270 [Marinobacterium zhoushanense]|uniref:DUF4197 domain-containing protein n=1 Tax=Marinobacterium zhoushanense TaxID=1679163 RepID=A0ABQ1K8J7_9GAMM|nr:DUF4197 domain-containing protein [Marinobacterium zhoushanense]GGB90974.1 hypothetical protein GCM10011352_16270 [Marinobacterium zhoushanense]